MSWRTLCVWLTCAVFSGCGSKKLFASYEVPPPGASSPYGLLALDVEAGDTRRPILQFAQTGYIPRHIPVPRDGVVVVRINPGKWKVQVTGSPGEGDVIKFSGPAKASGKARGPRFWPKEPIVVSVVASKLTNGGRLCAHQACKTVWSPFEASQFKAWADARRLVTYAGPVVEKPKPAKPEPEPSKSAP